MKLFATPNFRRKVKKFKKNQLIDLKVAIEKIVQKPELGIQKKGLLSDIFVYKFRMNKQLTLLAYKVEAKSLILYSVGPHENFYRDLEQSIQ